MTALAFRAGCISPAFYERPEPFKIGFGKVWVAKTRLDVGQVGGDERLHFGARIP